MRAYERSLVNYIVKKQYNTAQKFLITYNEHININNNIKFKHGIPMAPVFYLLQNNNDDIIELLKLFIKYGLDLEITDINGNTPLMVTCIENNINLVNFFLKNGSNTNTINNRQKTPLIVAIKNNNKDVIKLLLEYKADVTNPNLLLNCVTDRKRDINDPNDRHHFGMIYNYPIIKLLLNAGADPNVIKDDQFPALICSLGCYGVIKKIINEKNIDETYSYKKIYIRPINYVDTTIFCGDLYVYGDLFDTYLTVSFNLLQICFYNIINLTLLKCENKKRFKSYIKIAKFLIRNEIHTKNIINNGYVLAHAERPPVYPHKNRYIEEILEYKNKYAKEMYTRIYNFSMFPEVLCKIIYGYALL
jgi:hypothetical protein